MHSLPTCCIKALGPAIPNPQRCIHTHISAAEHEECIPGYGFHKKIKEKKERKGKTGGK